MRAAQMTRRRIEGRGDYLSVDCGHHSVPSEVSELYRMLAVECVEKQIDRVLVKAANCSPEGHLALRDALTVMILAGIPSGFRLAMVTDMARVQHLFLELQGDLRRLSIHLALFTDEANAVEWLLRKGMQHADARQAGAQEQA